jgi:hypothetical protein
MSFRSAIPTFLKADLRDRRCDPLSRFRADTFVSALTFSHKSSVNSRHPASVKPAALNLFSRDIRSHTMKKIFAALASVLLVSTAFAQTAAPASSSGQPTQPAGQANLKADAAAHADAGKADTSVKQASTATDKTDAKASSKKTVATHTAKTKAHKVSKTKRANVAGVDKTKTQSDTSKEASIAPVKTGGTKADTTQSN